MRKRNKAILIIVATWFVLGMFIACACGCSAFHPFGLGATANGPKPPGGTPTTTIEHAWNLAIYLGVGVTVLGLLSIPATGIKGAMVAGCGLALAVLAQFMSAWAEAIQWALGVLALAAVGLLMWEGWKHRHSLKQTVEAFNKVKDSHPDLWNELKARLPAKSKTAEAVVKGMGA